MLDWLAKLDPNVVIPLATGIVGWLWHQVRSDNHDSIVELASGFARQLVQLYLEQGGTRENATRWLEERLWSRLALRGYARNATLERLVHPVIEHAVADLVDELNERAGATLPGQVAELEKRAEGVLDAFKPKPLGG